MLMWIMLSGVFLLFPAAAAAWAAVKRDKRLEGLKGETANLPGFQELDVEICHAKTEHWLLSASQPARIIGDRKNGTDPVVLIQKDFSYQKDMDYLKLYILRELFRNKTKAQLKIMAALILPLSVLGSGMIWLYKISGLVNRYPFAVNVICPVLAAAGLTGCLVAWNAYVSRMEQRADRELLRYYTVKQVTEFILENERREKNTGKTEAFQQYYMHKRLQALKVDCG